MKGPHFQKIHLTDDKSFNILKVDRPYFIVPWHFHPEIEIMLVTEGTGTRFVGDSIESFEPYDLVVVGSNLAHVWKNSDEHYREGSGRLAEARVILFQEDCFGRDFFSIPEMKLVHELLSKAGRGMKFKGKTKLKVAEKIIDAFPKQGIDQFIALIEILKDLATSNEYSFLASMGYNPKVQASDLHRLNMVLDFLMQNFRKEIRLEEVAGIASMTTTAFCRYFKSRTNKTVVQFINELRIGYAHKRLSETHQNIDQICFECGFNNVSNFYKQFQKITGKSPFKFRKKYNERVF